MAIFQTTSFQPPVILEQLSPHGLCPCSDTRRVVMSRPDKQKSAAHGIMSGTFLHRGFGRSRCAHWHIDYECQCMYPAAGQAVVGSLPRLNGHRSVIINGGGRQCVWEAADDAARCCYTPRAVFGNTQAACYYSGSQWEQLNHELISPAKREKGENRERQSSRKCLNENRQEQSPSSRSPPH